MISKKELKIAEIFGAYKEWRVGRSDKMKWEYFYSKEEVTKYLRYFLNSELQLTVEFLSEDHWYPALFADLSKKRDKELLSQVKD